MDVTCVSDLHGHYPELESGDLLIVAGDLTSADLPWQLMKFGEWMTEQNYEKKIVIAGNHDNLIAGGRWKFCSPEEYGWNFTYLQDSCTEFGELKIWGSPWTKTFPGMNPHCKAFTCRTEKKLVEKWALIPDDIDILITHSPPYGIRDGVKDCASGKICECGSSSLYYWLKYVGRPKLHVFGHIHEGYGQVEIFPSYKNTMMRSVNASHVNEIYKPVNKPITIQF